MVPYKERVIEAAAKNLAAKTRKRPKDWLPIFKRFRKLQEHRLRLWHNAGGGGREIARQRADLMDIVFRELLESVSAEVGGRSASERFVVAAFGGYGRREMNPFSDVDIMFLLARGKPSARLEEIIRQTLVALWDLGFKVGHSTRSMAQAIKYANEDMLGKTSMLECRFLSGDRDLFNEFKERFNDECLRGREEPYFAWRFASQEQNREKYGASVFMQEPNIKNGCGGLRDYQNLLWIAFVKGRMTSMSKLVEERYLRASERVRLEKAYDFLLRVRTEMHYQNGRPIDSLTLQLQGKVATALGYPQRHILRRCEAFMRDYYSHTRNIHQITSAVIDRMQVTPKRQTNRLLSFFAPQGRPERFDGFVARDGKIFAENRETFAQDEFRLLRVFQHAQVRQLDLSPDLCDLIRRRVRLIDRTFQYARTGREVFFSILSRKGEVGRILRMMHDLGVLGRYLPEFGALTCLVQHEFFHRYTADEHTLVCTEKLDSVLFAEEERFAGYRSLFQKLEDPSILYLAILLHDTGKAANTRNHENESAILAQKVARRLQLSSERRRMLITLVDSHYSLSHSAQTRNLDDPATISDFAAVVRDRRNLDALMLLTLADGMGTSDESWSDWKESLVWGLYRKTADFLENGPAVLEQQQASRVELRRMVTRLVPRDFEEEARAHFEFMPERYFNAFDATTIAAHLKLFRRFFEKRLKSPDQALAPAFKWIARPDQGHSELWVCGWDRERLLEKITGSLLSVNLNILSADIFTRGDSLALDIFRVCDPGLRPVTNTQDIERVETRLLAALKLEDFDFVPLFGRAPRLRAYRVSADAELPSRIVIDSTSHPVFTIVEIQTRDRVGLLYALLRAFAEFGASIETSRVTTEMEVALDTFYVLGRDREKISHPDEIARLKTVLLNAAIASETKGA